ncbi:MAG: superoxide dismutase family protein [Opitutaceae bacterium]
MKTKHFIGATILAIAIPGIALAQISTPDSGEIDPSIKVPEGARVAIARLEPAEGSNVHGTVHFVEQKDGVRVIAKVAGLTPGDHGFHVHEKGDLSAPDLTSAGGHYNPEKKDHGGPKAKARHVGDMGNIVASSDGVGSLDYVDPHLSLKGEHSIVGRALIVHGGRDDLKSQPSGDAGPRVAGGIIRLHEGVKKEATKSK